MNSNIHIEWNNSKQNLKCFKNKTRWDLKCSKKQKQTTFMKVLYNSCLIPVTMLKKLEAYIKK